MKYTAFKRFIFIPFSNGYHNLYGYEIQWVRWLMRNGTTKRADRTVKKIPSSSKKKVKTADFQSIQIKPLNFPTPKALARKNRLQRTFWEYAMKIEEGNKNPEKTETW